MQPHCTFKKIHEQEKQVVVLGLKFWTSCISASTAIRYEEDAPAQEFQYVFYSFPASFFKSLDNLDQVDDTLSLMTSINNCSTCFCIGTSNISRPISSVVLYQPQDVSENHDRIFEFSKDWGSFGDFE